MKRVVCMLVMMLMAATFGMAQKAKTDDAGLRTIIQRATAKAAMEASEEWKWEEFLGLAQIDRSLIENYPYSDFLCYENDTRTFIALTHYDQMEEYYQGAGEVKWFKVGEVPQYRRFDPRTGAEQLAGVADETVERLLKNGKCIKLEDFKSAMTLAERKAKIERMKQMKQPKKIDVAKFERAHNEMMIYLAMVGSGKASIEMTKKFVKEAFNYEDSSRPWTYVLYHPQRRILKIQRFGDTYWKTFFLGADDRIGKNYSQPTNFGEMGKQIEGIMDLERDGFRVVFYSGSFNWEKLNPITNVIDNLKEVSTGGLPLYKNN